MTEPERPPSPTVSEHRARGLSHLGLAVITVSDTRTAETDSSGALVVELAEAEGHRVVAREIVPDEPTEMTPLLVGLAARADVAAIVMTGGTGISRRDRTPETVAALLTRTLPGFGEVFRMLSHAEIGSAAILSRALAGLIGETIVFALPGSRAAVQLAMTRIILPELPHLAAEAVKG